MRPVAHQVELTVATDDPGAFTFQPPGFQLHTWRPGDRVVSHTVYTDRYPGPFPFLTDPEYPDAHE